MSNAAAKKQICGCEGVQQHSGSIIQGDLVLALAQLAYIQVIGRRVGVQVQLCRPCCWRLQC